MVKGNNKVGRAARASLALALALALLALAGCGGAKPAEPKQEAPAAKADTKQEAKVEAKAEGAKFPSKPVKIVIGRAAGGSMDLAARLLQPYFSKYLGANVIIENIVGGAAKIANNQVYKAPPDGYTLLELNFPSDVLKQVVTPDLPYDINKFTPIGSFSGGTSPCAMVSDKSPIKTMADLVAAGKQKKLLMANTSGAANSPFAYALISQAAGVTFDLVPYESGNDSIMAVMGGHVDVAFSDASIAQAAHGKGIRVIGVALPRRIKESLPDVPSFSETYPGIGFEAVHGIVAPPNTPKEIVDVLATAMDKACKDPEFIKAAASSFDVVYKGPAEFNKMVQDNFATGTKLKDILMQFEGAAQAPAGKAKK